MAMAVIPPPSTLVKADLELSASDAVGDMSEEDGLLLEVSDNDQDARVAGSSAKTKKRKSSGDNAVSLGKGRQSHVVGSRKKKTKGLGGSISETTRRILLQHTSSDRSSQSKR